MQQRTAIKGRSSGTAPPSVAVVTPTRGTVQSRTLKAVLAALRHAEHAKAVKLVEDWWQFAHGLPIPASHEEATERALATGADLLWFIEDDNIPPPAALTASVESMERTGASVVAVNYPVGTRGTRWNSVHREDGEILFCGLGITLVDRKVFKKLSRPWFDLSRWYDRVPDGEGKTKLALIDKPFPAGRNIGGVDVVFGLRIREAGFTIAEVPRNARTSKAMVGAQIRTLRMGSDSGSGDNNSPHTIELWNTIDEDQRAFRAQIGDSPLRGDMNRFNINAEIAEWNRGWRQMGTWHSGFWMGANHYGPAFTPMHDQRITLARDTFHDANSVLELGSLEGGHTLAISRWADRVVGIEGREANARKARWVLERFHAGNAEIVEADLEDYRLADLGPFDLVVNIGVLYHMPDPVKLLARCAEAAPDLFLWTHVSPTNDLHEYREFGRKDPLSGLSPTSTWLPKRVLLAELRDRYGEVEVLGEEPNAEKPAITIAARRAK